jgi:hypothetical protein
MSSHPVLSRFMRSDRFTRFDAPSDKAARSFADLESLSHADQPSHAVLGLADFAFYHQRSSLLGMPLLHPLHQRRHHAVPRHQTSH